MISPNLQSDVNAPSISWTQGMLIRQSSSLHQRRKDAVQSHQHVLPALTRDFSLLAVITKTDCPPSLVWVTSVGTWNCLVGIANKMQRIIANSSPVEDIAEMAMVVVKYPRREALNEV